jgi:hypothetical protein
MPGGFPKIQPDIFRVHAQSSGLDKSGNCLEQGASFSRASVVKIGPISLFDHHLIGFVQVQHFHRRVVIPGDNADTYIHHNFLKALSEFGSRSRSNLEFNKRGIEPFAGFECFADNFVRLWDAFGANDLIGARLSERVLYEESVELAVIYTRILLSSASDTSPPEDFIHSTGALAPMFFLPI